ncbi:MAG TPA: hypothetical protein PKA00_03310 [Saprospiraceae bacterium]|mgnify:CR=1 FL=1|nr:hypothetical protein [Saprospiraceae bacterium]HMQ81904.1 hypothetical protein [Saprospiraceae bacterium]
MKGRTSFQIHHSIIILLITACCFSQFSYGQDDLLRDTLDVNKTVAVILFSSSSEYDGKEVEYSRMLTERVQTAIEQTKRFTMVERLDLEKVIAIRRDQDNNEQEYAYWKKLPESHLIEAGRQLGVEYIFTGNISNVAADPSVSGGYVGEFGFTIKAISVETGKLYVSESFRAASEKLIGTNSKQEALEKALEKVSDPVKEFVDRYFPIEVPLFKVKEVSKKGIPEIIIFRGGLSNGLRKDQQLDVVITVPGDKDYRDKIGEVKIVEIASKFCTCKVVDGGEAILKAIEAMEQILGRSVAHTKKGPFK